MVGGGGEAHLSPALVTIGQMKAGANFPMLVFLGRLSCAPVIRASSAVQPRQGAGPAFPSSVAGKREGQLPHKLEALRTRGGHLFLALTTTPQTREVVTAMPLIPSGWLTLTPVYRVNYCAAQVSRTRASSRTGSNLEKRKKN